MATWTSIDTARLEPGKPARSIDAMALRDNPIAIAEGAEGAPKIELAALRPLDPGGVVVFLFADISLANTVPNARSDTTEIYKFINRGTVTLTGSIASSGTGTAYGRVTIYKNGVAVYQKTNTSETFNINVAIDYGDTIHGHIQTQGPSDRVAMARLTNFQISISAIRLVGSIYKNRVSTL